MCAQEKQVFSIYFRIFSLSTIGSIALLNDFSFLFILATVNAVNVPHHSQQAQIENKINTIDNVIDMLCGIIGNEKSPSLSPKKISAPAREETKENRKSEDSSPERLKTKVIESLKKKKGSDRSVSTEE